ncbi:uncharacterized protein TNCV_2686781 [Trichonephila clavipes]|nr:uncharacterized protein TNCV_2686781 [Trichonephila clavipes]
MNHQKNIQFALHSQLFSKSAVSLLGSEMGKPASPLVRLLDGEKRWEAPEYHQSVLPQNWGETELNGSAMEDDVFFYALQKHCKIIESVLMSKCNMNNQVREGARQALGQLKASIYKNFERVKAANFLEACKQRQKETIASKVTPMRNPDIIVKNVPNEVNNEDLLKVISEQNPEVVIDDESIRQCRVRFTLKTFQHTRHVVIETHPTVRKFILRQTRLKIIWSACDVDDFLIINRCFNCLGYNHRADESNNTLACFHCSGEHKGQDCPNRDAAACTNCIRLNHKTKNIHKKVNVNHKPFSECCPCHIFMKKRIPILELTINRSDNQVLKCMQLNYSEIIKAATIVRSRHLSTFIDYKNTDYNMVTLEVIAGSTALILFSYYFEPSKNIVSDLHKINQVLSSKNLNRLVWSMDTNNKSELWFSPYSDALGVVGSDVLEDNSSWCLSENESLSDLVMIKFEFCLSTVLRETSSAPFVIFNKKKANWCHFRKFCFSLMTHIFDTLNSCTSSSCLNTVIEELSSVIYQECLYSVPIKKLASIMSLGGLSRLDVRGKGLMRRLGSRRRFQRYAFDNTCWPCIRNLLKKAEIPINIFPLVADILSDRVAKMQLGSTSAIRCHKKGCPQGSMSGPIFWNIINDLLFKLNNLACCEIIVFADDIIVCSQERNAINIIIQFSDKSTDDFPVICCTVGSKIDARVGSAFVVFRSGFESENLQFRIRDECTVFVAELLCLNLVVKRFTEQKYCHLRISHLY